VARDSVSNFEGNSMVKVPCSDDTPLASHNTGSYYSEISHFDSEGNSIGTSPKPIGKVVRLFKETLEYNKLGSKYIAVCGSLDSTSSNLVFVLVLESYVLMLEKVFLILILTRIQCMLITLYMLKVTKTNHHYPLITLY